MPISLVLTLQTEKNGRIDGSTGRAVHGFWFNQWQATAPNIADSLHQSNGIQPFTLSPLMGLPHPNKGNTPIKKGDSAWLRITTLDEAISQPFLESWLTRLPAHIDLADTSWTINTIALSPREHQWARQQPYQTVADNAVAADQWKFECCSPTAFRLGKHSHLPFPLPGMLVNSWMRRWNAFSPSPLPDSYSDLFREELFISAYQLNTVPVRYGNRLTIGCVGQFTLRAGNLTTAQRTALSTLADYAFYCGSGAHTTQGMGMTMCK